MCRPRQYYLRPARVWLYGACAERERPSLALPRRESRGVVRATHGVSALNDVTTDDDDETQSNASEQDTFDGGLEFLLHFARGGGTAVLANLAAACDAAHVAAHRAPTASARSGALLRKAGDARASAPDLAKAATQLGVPAAIRLMAARAARGCARVHDFAVRTCVGKSDAKKLLRRAEKAAMGAVSEIRAIGTVVRQEVSRDVRRRLRRAEKAGVDRVLESLALAVGILHIAMAGTSQQTQREVVDIRRSASARQNRSRGRVANPFAAFWG